MHWNREVKTVGVEQGKFCRMIQAHLAKFCDNQQVMICGIIIIAIVNDSLLAPVWADYNRRDLQYPDYILAKLLNQK